MFEHTHDLPNKTVRLRAGFQQLSTRKGKRIIWVFGAGDGNRTHVRSLGS